MRPIPRPLPADLTGNLTGNLTRERPCSRPSRAASASSWPRLVAMLALCWAASAGAQNLAGPNADFDAAAGGWSFIGTGTWDGNDDFDGCTGVAGASGAVDVASEAPAQPGDPSISAAYPLQCIGVLPGETLYTEVAYRSDVDADVVPAYFDTENCTGGVIEETIDGNFPASAGWALAADTIIVPAGALSALVAWAAADANGQPFTTSWDRAYVGRRARIFADDFEAGSTCRWSFAAGI